jgi:hypothetical protein
MQKLKLTFACEFVPSGLLPNGQRQTKNKNKNKKATVQK